MCLSLLPAFFPSLFNLFILCLFHPPSLPNLFFSLNHPWQGVFVWGLWAAQGLCANVYIVCVCVCVCVSECVCVCVCVFVCVCVSVSVSVSGLTYVRVCVHICII